MSDYEHMDPERLLRLSERITTGDAFSDEMLEANLREMPAEIRQRITKLADIVDGSLGGGRAAANRFALGLWLRMEAGRMKREPEPTDPPSAAIIPFRSR